MADTNDNEIYMNSLINRWEMMYIAGLAFDKSWENMPTLHRIGKEKVVKACPSVFLIIQIERSVLKLSQKPGKG